MKKYLLLSLCLLLGLGAFAQRSSNRVLQIEEFSEKNSVYERSSDVEVLIEDDFESYTPGSKIASEAVAAGIDWWTTWSNAPGSSEDGKIVEINGNKCAYLKYGNDQVLKLGAAQSGVYDLEFDIMIPFGGCGYFSILHKFNSGNSTWAMQAYLHMTNDGQNNRYAPFQGTVHAGSNSTADVAATYDEWMHFRLHVDTDADLAQYYYTTPGNEEILVCKWQWSLDSFGENIVGRELDAMNFFPPDSDSEYYLDNFKYTRIGGETAAELEFSPLEINGTIAENDMSSVTISIENNGTSIGEYSAWVDYGTGEGGDNEEIVSYAIDNVSDPSGLSWNSDEPMNFEVAALFPASSYGNSVMGTYITKAAYAFYEWIDGVGNSTPGLEPGSDVIFRIYGQGHNGNPGRILAEKVIGAEDIVKNEYTIVEFDEPVALTGYDVYVAVEMTAAVEGIAMTLDGSGQAVQGYGDIYRENGGAFKSITETSGSNYGNWCLYMVCEGVPVVGGYATLDKTSGTLPIGGSDEVVVNLSSVGLAEGTYNAFVKFSTNDPATSLVSIPINLLVEHHNNVNIPTDSYTTDAIMHTTYDLQSNGQVSNRMYHREDGSVAVVATMSHEYDQSASDRGTIYNFFDGNSWGDYPYERAEANATGNDMRTGWPSIAPYGENGEILVNHSNGLNYYIRETAGEGLWDGPYSIPAFDYSYSLSWPRVVTSGENNEIIHVFSAANGNDGRTAQFYSRFDGEEWTTQWSPLYNTNEHIGIYNADDYCISANGSVVAVVYATPFYGDVLMYKSTDNGLTWTKYVVWENPYKGDWETDEETITGGVNDPAAQTPTMSTVAVGPDGVVHVAFSVANYAHRELGTTFSYYHGRTVDGIAYWNDRREPISNIKLWNEGEDGYMHHSYDSINFCGWMPFYDNIAEFDNNMIYRENDYIYTFYGVCSGYPALSVDTEGNLALAYSTIDSRRNNGSHYYRSVFVSYKAAGDESWNVAVEDLTEDFMFTLTEAISVSAASVSAKENEFWFSFLGDDTPGFYWGNGASQSHATDNYVYVSKFVPGEYGDDEENDDDNDDNNDDITLAYRNVLIETFTGRNSGYEPDAHKIANELAAANPGRVFPVNIHCGGFSTTSFPNMNTTVGTEMLNAYNVQGFPCGNINRNSESPISRSQWSSETYNQLSQMTEVNVSGLVKINPLDRVAEITVDLEYVSSGNYNTNYLTVMMLQDSIWGSQSGGSFNPEQYVNGQYCHMHVLRDIITPTWGDAVSPTTSGTHITKTYIYEIPEIIGDPNGVDVDLNNIYFLAFVTEAYQGTPTRPVLNVDKLDKVYGTDEAIYPYISTIADISEIPCSSMKTLNVNLVNGGLNNITSLGFEIYIDGYFVMEQVWHGNIPSYQSSNIQMDVEIPVGTHDVEIKIVEANGIAYENEKTVSITSMEWTTVLIDGEKEEFTIDIMQDKYGNQITWELVASDGTTLASGGPYNMLVGGSAATQLHRETVTINNGECVQFAIRDNVGNGICCEYGEGYYQIKDSKGKIIVNGDGDFGSEDSVLISVVQSDQSDIECEAPTDLTYYIDEYDYNNVILSWSAPAGADSANVTYEIYSSSTSMTPLYYGITETSFTIEDLSAGNYRYVVRANWNDECLSDPSNMVEFTIADCAPDDMIGLTITMSDSYGDGWNGGYIEIVGETNGSTYTIEPNNGSNDTITLSLCPDVYYFNWNNGVYDGEVGFEIFVEENEVYSVAEGTIDDSFSNPFFVLRFEDIFASISDVTYNSAFCSTETNFNINVVNEGLQEITSIKMEAVVDGTNNDAETIEFTWQGSIPPYQSANIETTLDLPVGYHNVDFRIVEINGVPFETSKSIDVNVEEGIDTYVNGNSGEYTIDVMPTGYGGTISWEIVTSDNSVLSSGEFSNNGTYLNTETVTIPAGECVRFIIRNSNNNFNNGYYRIFDDKGNVVVYNEGNFGYEQSYLLSVISDDNMDDSYAENTFNVNVDVPGTLSYKLAAMIEHWSDVYVLKVNGELNTSDFDVFSKLTHLMTLDLTQTNITSIGGCKELSRLRNVYLPATVTSVNNQAFYNCKSLYSIDLPNATTIGYYTFYNCYSLASINIPNVTSINYDAFAYCQSLTSIDISNAADLATNSNYGIFGHCTDLSEVVLSDELTYIPYECFCYCTSLQEINLPASLKTINGYAFYGCALTDINIPEGVTSIGECAFEYCPATTISIPSSIISIGSYVFSNGNITDVYCYAATPVTTSTFNGGLSYATLHVPEFSVVAYKVHDSWYKFNIVALDELLADVYINSDYTIVDYNGLADEVNLTLDLNAHLTVTAGSEFVLNNYKQITSNIQYSGDYPSTLITYNEMNANDVEVSLVLRTDRWNFISLPFDVNVSDITYPEGTLWVVRKYSGEDRANMTGNTWHNMTDGMTLNAGEGYILHCDHANNSYVTFTFPAVNNESMNNMFAHQDFEQHLEIYPSEFAHNRSWNLVGNPYPSYFNTNGNIEHNGIITVWDNAYVAYSLLDDYFTLKPYESFFVQCPDDATSMLFKTEGRSHTNDYDDYNKRDEAFRQRNSGDRKIYNFTLNNEEYSDRTRLVLNEAASVDYELSCDASKFMNEDENVPQVYVYDNDVMYAINERPLGLGMMSLGIRIGQSGEYTLALDPKEEYGQKVVLYDNETREEIDILNGSYTFFAEEGYDNDRFVLTITENTIGIDESYILDINDPDVEVYDIYGRRVRVSDAKNGLYILRKGDMVQRYFISE